MRNTEQDFWKKVNKVDGGCWLWTGGVNNKGYGQIRLNGKLWFVHRLSYSLLVSEIPTGKFLCHKCDVPICCNPGHLYIGDQSDNMIDMVVRKRRSNQVLDSDIVKKIRNLKNVHLLTPAKIANRLSLSISLVKKVYYGENWSHVK